MAWSDPPSLPRRRLGGYIMATGAPLIPLRRAAVRKNESKIRDIIGLTRAFCIKPQICARICVGNAL